MYSTSLLHVIKALELQRHHLRYIVQLDLLGSIYQRVALLALALVVTFEVLFRAVPSQRSHHVRVFLNLQAQVLNLVLELGLVLLVRLVLRVLVLVPKAQRVMVPVLVLVVPWLALVLKAEQMQPTVRPVSAADLPTWATRAT
jgi:hypothetical protein